MGLEVWHWLLVGDNTTHFKSLPLRPPHSVARIYFQFVAITISSAFDLLLHYLLHHYYLRRCSSYLKSIWWEPSLKPSSAGQILKHFTSFSLPGCCRAGLRVPSARSRCGEGCAWGRLLTGSALAECLHSVDTQRIGYSIGRYWCKGISSQSCPSGIVLLQSLGSTTNHLLLLGSPLPWKAISWAFLDKSQVANHW